MTTILMPAASGAIEPYTLSGTPLPPPPAGAAPRFPRVAYAAAHVVVDPLADNDPFLDTAFDWERTLSFRHHLWDLGFGVAEAMDTAQRGMGLSWPDALELSKRAIAEAKSRPGAVIACGAGTDQLDPGPDVTIDDVIAAYEAQVEAIEAEPERPYIDPEGFHDAKSVAPGYDVYALYDQWVSWWIDSGRPELKSPRAAFIGFCRNKHKTAPLR